MLTVQHPVVMGFFANEAKAKEIIEILEYVGFRGKQLMIVMNGEHHKFQGFLKYLLQMGIPGEEIQLCEQKFEAGHSIVSVQHNGNPWQAITILYEGRIHKYIKRLEGRNKVRQTSPESEILAQSLPQNTASQQEYTLPSWQKLLTDAGFGYLI